MRMLDKKETPEAMFNAKERLDREFRTPLFSLDDISHSSAGNNTEEVVDDSSLDASLDAESTEIKTHEEGNITDLENFELRIVQEDDVLVTEEGAGANPEGAAETSRRHGVRLFDGLNALVDTVQQLEEDAEDFAGNIKLYPRFGSRGTVGEVHANQAVLEVFYTGYDMNDDHFLTFCSVEDLVCLKVNIHREYVDNCVHGGQFYNPFLVSVNVSRISPHIKKNIAQIVLWMLDYLSGNRPANIPGKVKFAKEQLFETLSHVAAVLEKFVDKENVKDNSLMRIEFTMCFSEEEGQHRNETINSLKLFWPSLVGLRVKDGTSFCFKRCFFIVPQRYVYEKFCLFQKESVDPVLKLLNLPCENDVHELHGATKLFLLFCCEQVMKELSNTFFRGKILPFLEKYCERGGSIGVASSLRVTDIPSRDKEVLEIKFGLHSCCFPTIFRRQGGMLPRSERMRILLENLRKNTRFVEFPDLYYSTRDYFWVLLQRFSMKKTKHDVIGVFDEPNWEYLAVLDSKQMTRLVQLFCMHVLNVYYKSWFRKFLLISKKWSNEEHKAAITVEINFPTKVEQLQEFAGTLFDATSREAKERQEIPADDRKAITKIGEYGKIR